MVSCGLPTIDISGEQSEHDQLWVTDNGHEWRAIVG